MTKHWLTAPIAAIAALAMGLTGAASAWADGDTADNKDANTVDVTAPQPLTVHAAQNLDGHTFTALRLAKITHATLSDNNQTIETVSLRTDDKLAQAIGKAAKTAGATDADIQADPMAWVAKTLTDSDISPWAGRLRDFVTALTADDTIAKTTGEPMTVHGQTATGTYTPGVYLIRDTSAGPASIPMLAATTIDGKNTADKRLGQVEWKAQGAPTPEKTLTSVNGSPFSGQTASVNIGEKLGYRVTETIPTTTGFSHYRLSMTDTLPAALDAPTVTAVTLDHQALKADQYQTTVTADPKTGTHTLTVTLGGKDGDALPIISDKAGKTLAVDYSSALNIHAKRSEGTVNTAQIHYSDNPGDWNHTGTVDVPDPVTVYTGGLTVKKTDKAGKPLDGAHFQVTRDRDDNAQPLTFTKTADGYVFDPAGTTTDLETTNGTLEITGLVGRVTVKETVSPLTSLGILLPKTTLDLKADQAGTTATIVKGDPTNLVSTSGDTLTVINVENLTQLPRTGLAGTLLWAVPLTLALGAGLLLTRKARA